MALHLNPLKYGKSKVAQNPSSLKKIAIIYGMVSLSNTLTCMSKKLHNGNFGKIYFHDRMKRKEFLSSSIKIKLLSCSLII